MYKHILLPTDGSALAMRGARAGIRLAKSLRARVTAVYIIPRYVMPLYGEGTAYVPAVSIEDYKRATERQAKKALARVAAEARRAGVRCATRFRVETPAWRGLLAAARAARAKAIVMASHGRGGLGGMILGSETQRVLAQSKIPVLVVR
jgi:nucleotide-binding universal stress UspA family protein